MTALRAEHVAELERSAIPLELATFEHLASLTVEQVRRATNNQGIASSGLGFPYYIPNGGGEPSHFCTNVKLDVPHAEGKKKTKPRKYMRTAGVDAKPYVPLSTRKMIAETDGNCPLIVVEGEKKALALVALGFPAIALPGVANWSKPRTDQEKKDKAPRVLLDDIETLVEPLEEVTILFDTDPKPQTLRTVRSEARLFARALERLGKTVTIGRLPLAADGSKGAIDDILAALTLEHRALYVQDVLGLARPETWFSSHGELAFIDSEELLMGTPPRAQLFDGLLPEGTIALFVGPPKVGKSAFMQTLAIAAATGTAALNTFQANGARFVMMVGVDQGRQETAERWRRAAGKLEKGALKAVHHWGLPTFTLGEKSEDVERLGSWVKWALDTTKRAPLVVIDTLRSSIPAEISENASEIGPMIAGLRPITDLGASVVLVHHSGHASEGRPDASAARGSSAITGAVDDVWVARPISDGWFTLSFDARRSGEPPKPLAVKVNHEDYGVSIDDPATRQAITTRALVLDWLRRNGEAGPKEIADEIKRSRSTVHGALRDLVSAHEANEVRKGVYSALDSDGSASRSVGSEDSEDWRNR